MAITRERAQKDGITGGCPLMDGREKLDFDSIIGEVITVEAFAEVEVDKNGKKEVAYAMNFVEYPEHYAWAGGCLKKFIEAYHDEFIGTKLTVGEKVKTKSNNDYRVFEVYDETPTKGKKK